MSEVIRFEPNREDVLDIKPNGCFVGYASYAALERELADTRAKLAVYESQPVAGKPKVIHMSNVDVAYALQDPGELPPVAGGEWRCEKCGILTMELHKWLDGSFRHYALDDVGATVECGPVFPADVPLPLSPPEKGEEGMRPNEYHKPYRVCVYCGRAGGRTQVFGAWAHKRCIQVPRPRKQAKA